MLIQLMDKKSTVGFTASCYLNAVLFTFVCLGNAYHGVI